MLISKWSGSVALHSAHRRCYRKIDLQSACGEIALKGKLETNSDWKVPSFVFIYVYDKKQKYLLLFFTKKELIRCSARDGGGYVNLLSLFLDFIITPLKI